ncbi:molybdopterin-binding protein [Thermosulfuriphilus sp.]
MKYRTVPVEEAVGMVIPHDITEIRPGIFKGPAFRKGHIITAEDIPHLKRLGKDHIYVIEYEKDDLHENEAALILAKAVAGEGVSFDPEVVEGKITFKAARDGLFKVEKEALLALNLLGEVMLATRHGNLFVRTGESLAAGRAIPLVVKKSLVDQAAQIARETRGILKVLPFIRSRASLVITGSEVFYGRISDAFEPVMREKLSLLGAEIISVAFAPDEVAVIQSRIQSALEAGAEFILCTGGMSVDPDDVTRVAIKEVGAQEIYYGSAVLPGAMFLVAYIKDVPILGIPACAMYHRITVLDLVLPRIMAGEKIGRRELAELGHGGYCLNCKPCRFPICPFGRG